MSIHLRVGLGCDTHQLTPGGPLRIGGVNVPHDHHLAGHSDADVLLHAITDALLGAAAEGDIGTWFPNNDDANRGRDSAEMLSFVWKHLEKLGYRLVNLDCIVMAQRPKLAGHRDEIRARIAEILQCKPEQVGLKGKTGEHVGPVGRQEAIEAQAVALLEKL